MYHDDKLIFWLLWLASTATLFRWALFNPCRQCRLFDKSIVAVFLTQTCGLQDFFSGHSALWLFLISQLFLPFKVHADRKRINFFLVFESVYLQKDRAAWDLWFQALSIKWIHILLFKDFINSLRLGLIFMQSDFGWDTNAPNPFYIQVSSKVSIYHLLSNDLTIAGYSPAH